MKQAPPMDTTFCGYQCFSALACAAATNIKKINTPVKLAQNKEDKLRIIAFLNRYYGNNYPNIKADLTDRYFKHALMLFIEDASKSIIATCSIAFDDGHALPDEALFSSDIQQYRADGKHIVEIVRWVADANKLDDQKNLAKQCLKAVYQLCRGLGVDLPIGLVRQKEANLHKKFGAQIFKQNLDISDCPKYKFATAAWPLDKMQHCFFRQTNSIEQPKGGVEIYPLQQWDDYSRIFTSITTVFQRQTYQSACQYLYGDVVDLGCGSAKIAPWLGDIKTVNSYLGIDYSKEMIRAAKWTISTFQLPTFGVWQGKIEGFREQTFDCAVSINSYYSWPEPVRVLKHIFNLLHSGGIFILATPNPQIDMLALEQEAKKELVGHPDWEQFKTINRALAQNPRAQFINMSDLIDKVQSVGFTVQSAHQELLLGGLNFLILKKERSSS